MPADHDDRTIEEKLAQADRLIRQGDAFEALQIYQQILAATPDDSRAYLRAGMVLLTINQRAAARQFFRDAADTAQTPEQLADAAIALEEVNDGEAAMTAWQRVREISPSDSGAWRAWRRAKARVDFFAWTNTGAVGRPFFGDMMATLGKAVGFLSDQRFQEAFWANAGTQEEDAERQWRLHTLCWAARHCLNLPGDFVECGVFAGFMSKTVCDYVDFAKVDKTFYLYDTYEGFSPKYSSEADFPDQPGFFRYAQKVFSRPGLHEFVRERFADVPNARVIKGAVPDSLHGTAPGKIAYLHIDMNSPAPEIGALEVLFDRVVPNGLIIFDDYGWGGHKLQKDAEDAWFAQRGYAILEMPTGQGLVVKR